MSLEQKSVTREKANLAFTIITSVGTLLFGAIVTKVYTAVDETKAAVVELKTRSEYTVEQMKTATERFRNIDAELAMIRTKQSQIEIDLYKLKEKAKIHD